MEFIFGSEIKERIATLLKEAKEARIAVAFWGYDAVSSLGLDKLSCPLKIVCNLDVGATNPDEIQKLLDQQNVKIRTNRRLHAKVWWTEKAVILGSANASANGLNLEGNELTNWIEANAFITDREVIDSVRTWFDDLWGGSIEITAADIEDARKLWAERRHARPHLTGGNSLLDALLSQPEAFRDRGDVIICFPHGEMPPWALRLNKATIRERGNPNLECYVCDSDGDNPYTPGSFVIEFDRRGGDNNPVFCGTYKIEADRHIVRHGRKQFIVLCHEVMNIRGFVIPRRDRPRWARLVAELNWDEDRWYRTFYEFARELMERDIPE